MGLHIVIQWDHLFLDFWNDEIATLQKFVFQPIGTTLLDYHDTNNHIFFNVINNIYLKLLGIESLHELMDFPWVLRMLPLLYSLGMLIALFKLVEYRFGSMSATLVGMVLIFSIPYFNFALQLRGYGLSMMLISLLLYQVVKAGEHSSIMRLAGITMLSGLLFYTIPLNLLFLAALLVVVAGVILWNAVTKKSLKEIIHLPHTKIFAGIVLGIGICLLLYLPMFDEVFGNRHVVSKRSIWNPNLAVFHVTMLSFVSKQYGTIGLAAIGFWMLEKKRKMFVLMLTGLVLLPFLLAYGMGMAVFERVFVNLVILYALIIGISAGPVFRWLSNKHQWLGTGIMILVGIQVLYVFLGQNKRIRTYLVKEEIRGQGLYFNYFLEYFEPKAEVEFFIAQEPDYQGQILVYNCEPYGFHNYLDWAQLDYRIIHSLDELKSIQDSVVYVATTKPSSVIQYAESVDDKVHARRINDQLLYNNFVRVERR